jgi:hypothetical protein
VKQNPDTGVNPAANIPVYDGFGNPINNNPAPATTESPFAAPADKGGDNWSNWFNFGDTQTEKPFESTTEGGDDWDAWLNEQKQQKGWEEDWDDEVKEEEDFDNFSPDFDSFTPGLSNEFPSVQETGRKFVSSDAHKHPSTDGSSFLSNSRFTAVHNANRPVIVAGLCSLIVMVVLVMFFIARKT